MKKALKRRFVLSAMLSFLIVIVLLVGSIAFINYQNEEKMADSFLKALLSESARPMQGPPPNWFGYQFTQESFPAGFYTLHTDRNGNILKMDQIGILQGEADVQNVVRQIVQNKLTEGKSGSYQFRADYGAPNQTVRLVLLDRTTQMISLYNVLKTGALVGLACLTVLFLVLQPIAGHVTNEWLRKTEQQKQFITNAGHELKTPVAIILSNIEALELIEGENKYSRNIHQQTQRLGKLIKQLLMVARLDEIRYRSETRVLDFTSIVKESCNAFAESLHLQCSLQENCRLRGHDESLRQLMDVILDNALRYGNKEESVEVKLHMTGKHIVLSLTNQVEKLPSCQPDELFERFSRGDSSRTQRHDSGCGVGLSAARTIVRLHRGSIQIDFPTQQTFRVNIILPAYH